ncbi:MAG: type I-E CRISPR-associated protein Cse1/CasA [Clostridiales Family XIII bacterium]|jgi:CRISPR system Cascade subunit CasA|nr:type I-E CRISPR-associated protein Cse1/CasA [Clostridiales Family XIII bacterium]
MNKEFNLLDEKWIRVLDENGRPAELSLLEAFARAHGLRRLANETETADMAILRLLLAILHAVFSSVDADGNDIALTNENAVAHWKSLWDRAGFPQEALMQYLEYFRERFWLFHPETPFYQTADLVSRKCTEYRTPKLIGDISQSENKGRLFPGRTDSARLSYPEAARWLLHVNAFDDTSAKPSVRGAGMESTGAGWLGKLGLLFSEGKNLFQTLLLNFVLLDPEGKTFKRGTPVWEAPARAEERVRIAQPESLAELYTLQSRRLLLMRDNGGGVGYKLLGGDFFEKENAFIEPMTLWRRDPKTDVFTPKRHNPARQIWRDFEALIAGKDGNRIPGVVKWNETLVNEKVLDGMRLKFSAPSVRYGDKDFFVDDMFSDSVSINARLLDELGDKWRIRIVEILKKTDEAVQAFGRFASNLALAEGTDDEKGNIAGIRNTARERAYGELDIPFRRWLASIEGDEDMEAVSDKWKDEAKSILLGLANEMLDAVGDAAFIGRKGHTAFTAESHFKSGLNKAFDPS